VFMLAAGHNLIQVEQQLLRKTGARRSSKAMPASQSAV